MEDWKEAGHWQRAEPLQRGRDKWLRMAGERCRWLKMVPGHGGLCRLW